MRLNDKQRKINFVFAVAILLFFVWVIYTEVVTYRPWKSYQKEFKQIELKATKEKLQALQGKLEGTKDEKALKKLNNDIVLTRTKLDKVKASGPKIMQKWLIQFNGEADRCITCHQAAEKPGFDDQAEPYKTHEAEYFKHHPVKTYGCVICHDGQGHALNVHAAHGEPENWLKPLHGGSYSQASCGKCHALDQKLPVKATTMQGGEKFVEGWRLYMEYNCLGCHVNSAYERPKRIGPVLTPVGKKVRPQWIKMWISNPRDYLPETVMPNFMLEDDKIELIAAYLFSLSGGEVIKEPKSAEMLGDEAAVASGRKLVTELGCLGCHTIEQIDKDGGKFGPNLSNIAGKASADWLFYWLKNPRRYQADTPMPNLRIPEEEIQDIVAFLSTLKGSERMVKLHMSKGPEHMKSNRVSTDPKDIEAGRQLIKDTGCTGCHEIDKFAMGFNAPPHDGIGSKRFDELDWGNVEHEESKLIPWLEIKVKEPRKFATEKIISKMPDFGFNKEQVESLVTFLLSFSKDQYPVEFIKQLNDPEDVRNRGKKLLEERNCLGCHTIDDVGGDYAPNLSMEAKKVRAEWLINFLREPYRIRPLEDTRMPDFNLSFDDVQAAIEYLSYIREDKYPFKATQKVETYLEDIEAGKELYQKELACLGCHTFEGMGGYVGPEHTDMASRLRREWVEEWVTDPQKIKPDVRMPRFVFKGDEKKFLIDYLMTMGRERFLSVQ